MPQVYWQQALVMVTSSSKSEGTDCFHVGLQEPSFVPAGLCCAHQAFRRLGASMAPASLFSLPEGVILATGFLLYWL